MAGQDPSKCPCDWCVDYRHRISLFARPPKERGQANRPKPAPREPEKVAPPEPAKVAPRRRRRNAQLIERFQRIRAEDKVCRYCLAAPAESVDHIVPVSRGGSDREENLVGCCLACNHGKGALLPKEAGLVLHVPLRLVRLASRRP